MTAPADVRTCYRHPDRVAGIVCQRCDRPICPECMHQASVGFHCPECTARTSQQVHRGIPTLRDRPVVTQVLIGANVLVYLLATVTSGREPWSAGGQLLFNRLGYGGLQGDGVLLGSIVPHEPWRLVSSGFLHGGLMHLGFNMLALYVLGSVLEPVLGRLRFGVLYGAGLLAGSLGVVFDAARTPTLGASGAVFALMGTILLVARERNVDLVRSGLLPIVGFNLLITFTLPMISIGGHLGGLAGGLVFGLVLTRGDRLLGTRSPVITSVVVAGLGIACALAAYGLMSADYGHIPLS